MFLELGDQNIVASTAILSARTRAALRKAINHAAIPNQSSGPAPIAEIPPSIHPPTVVSSIAAWIQAEIVLLEEQARQTRAQLCSLLVALFHLFMV